MINYSFGQVTFVDQPSAETATGTFSCGDKGQVLLEKGNQHLYEAGQQKEAWTALKKNSRWKAALTFDLIKPWMRLC